MGSSQVSLHGYHDCATTGYNNTWGDEIGTKFSRGWENEDQRSTELGGPITKPAKHTTTCPTKLSNLTSAKSCLIGEIWRICSARMMVNARWTRLTSGVISFNEYSELLPSALPRLLLPSVTPYPIKMFMWKHESFRVSIKQIVALVPWYNDYTYLLTKHVRRTTFQARSTGLVLCLLILLTLI